MNCSRGLGHVHLTIDASYTHNRVDIPQAHRITIVPVHLRVFQGIINFLVEAVDAIFLTCVLDRCQRKREMRRTTSEIGIGDKSESESALKPEADG